MENEQDPEEFFNETKKSFWNSVTPLSKYLAMALFVALPFIGGWVGYTFAPEKVVVIEKIVEVEKVIEMSEPLSYSREKVSGECFKDIEKIEPLYTNIETEFLRQFPSYETLYRTWWPDKSRPKGRSYSNAIFGCELSDGTHLASFVYENNNYQHNNLAEPKFRFRLIQFENDGGIVNISPENGDPSIGGTFEINNVTEGVVEFTSKVIDPCYSATHSYSYDISLNAYREQTKGGVIENCGIPSPGAL